MEKTLTLRALRAKAYLTEEECIAVLRCYYKIDLLREYLRQNKLNVHYLQAGNTRYYKSESIMKVFDTLRYVKKWRPVYANFLPEK